MVNVVGWVKQRAARSNVGWVKRSAAPPETGKSAARKSTARKSWWDRAALVPPYFAKPTPGLKVYDVLRPGGRRRFHLRTNPDGAAVLLIDAMDAIHLNPTAALLAQLALEEVPLARAAAVLRSRFRGVGAAESRAAARQVYALIERLTDLGNGDELYCGAGVSPAHEINAGETPAREINAGVSPAREINAGETPAPQFTGTCPTCGLREETVQWSPPFSVPVSAPYKADLALSYGCNNRCPHCYNQCQRTAPSASAVAGRLDRVNSPLSSLPSPLSLDQWQKVLDRLAAVGIPHIIFTGGEPTLCDGLPDLIRRATELGLVSGLNTNGRRLSDPAFVRSLSEAGLDHVQITLQSPDPAIHDAMSGTAAFNETLRGVENSLAAGLHTITNTTLTRQNVAGAARLVEFLHGLGVRTFACNGMIFSGGGQTCGDAIAAERLAPVLAQVRDRAVELKMRFLWYTPTEYCRLSPVELELGPRRCNAGEYSICIEPNGDVIPCQSYYVAAGNILRDRWEDIWESTLFRGFRRRTADPRAAGLPERCWDCPDLPICGGGCPLEREHDKTSCSHAPRGNTLPGRSASVPLEIVRR